MHDYNPLAVLAFVALTLVAAVGLMFLLAWMEPTAAAPRRRLQMDPRPADRGEKFGRPVSLVLESRSTPIMKMGRREAATG